MVSQQQGQLCNKGVGILEMQSGAERQKQELQIGRQNEQMKRIIEGYLEEIQRQKAQNEQHENEIESLLKFNERLLYIIENEVANRRDTGSLMPISEKSERESDIITKQSNMISSLIKTKKTIAAKSEKGPVTNTRSVNDYRHDHDRNDAASNCEMRLEQMGHKNIDHSEVLHSECRDSESYKQMYSTYHQKNRRRDLDMDRSYDEGLKMAHEREERRNGPQHPQTETKSFKDHLVVPEAKVEEQISNAHTEDPHHKKEEKKAKTQLEGRSPANKAQREVQQKNSLNKNGDQQYEEQMESNNRRYDEIGVKFSTEINSQLEQIEECKKMNSAFYSSKIQQLDSLKDRIGSYDPESKFKEISAKVAMNPATANLVKQALLIRNR